MKLLNDLLYRRRPIRRQHGAGEVERAGDQHPGRRSSPSFSTSASALSTSALRLAGMPVACAMLAIVSAGTLFGWSGIGTATR